MAVYNEIQVGRFNRFLQKLLSMKGPASMNTLAPELMPVLAVFSGRENRYLDGWDLFGAGVNLVTGVGNKGAFRIRNPAGSNVIAVVESFTASLNVGDIVRLSMSLAAGLGDFGTIDAISAALDKRSGRTASTVILSETPNGGLTGNQIAKANVLANTTWEFIWHEDQQIPIAPGSALGLDNESATNPTTFMLSVRWRERPLEDSERA